MPFGTISYRIEKTIIAFRKQSQTNQNTLKIRAKRSDFPFRLLCENVSTIVSIFALFTRYCL